MAPYTGFYSDLKRLLVLYQSRNIASMPLGGIDGFIFCESKGHIESTKSRRHDN